MTDNKIDRRRFLKNTGTGLAGITLLTKLPLSAHAQNAAASLRRVYPLNHNWLFREQAQPSATATTFNDAAFKRVTIPHTNKVLPWHGFDDQDYEFVSVYRRHFKLPPELKDRRVFVDFRRRDDCSDRLAEWTTTWGVRAVGYTPFHLN
jgi:beta-galactosidase